MPRPAARDPKIAGATLRGFPEPSNQEYRPPAMFDAATAAIPARVRDAAR